MDGTVRLWDLLSGVCLHKLEEHKGKPRVSAAVVVVTALCSPPLTPRRPPQVPWRQCSVRRTTWYRQDRTTSSASGQDALGYYCKLSDWWGLSL